jgi:hypothetical protein
MTKPEFELKPIPLAQAFWLNLIAVLTDYLKELDLFIKAEVLSALIDNVRGCFLLKNLRTTLDIF